MATLNELFAGAPAAARATVRTTTPEQPAKAAGVPPGDNRYGQASPLTDQFAGRTLAQLLEDAGERVDPAAWIQKNLRREKPPVYSGPWGSERLYFRGMDGGPELPNADQLMVISTQEAQSLLAGAAPEPPQAGASLAG